MSPPVPTKFTITRAGRRVGGPEPLPEPVYVPTLWGKIGGWLAGWLGLPWG